ncbi:MAG: Rossmann-like and DUF2520 domain-containing protein [Pyrinomonadaceae bacterium]
MKSNNKIAVIGIGRLGGALALALSNSDFEITRLVSRNGENAEKIARLINPSPEILNYDELNKIDSEIIFITTPDPQTQRTAELLSENLHYSPFIFHCSGALSSEILDSLKNIGCQTASLHPLVSISDSVLGAKKFENAFFCIEGDGQACQIAENIVARLKGKSFSVPTEFKTLYHASAVMASGHLTALFSAAVESLMACGLDGEHARTVLFPLLKSTVENLSAQTPAQALTGTFARADVETLKRHLETLRENASPEILEIYRILGLRSLHLAAQQSADAEKLAEMKRLLTEINI